MARLTLRLPDELKHKLAGRAETERRSLNDMIVLLLERSMKPATEPLVIQTELPVIDADTVREVDARRVQPAGDEHFKPNPKPSSKK